MDTQHEITACEGALNAALNAMLFNNNRLTLTIMSYIEYFHH